MEGDFSLYLFVLGDFCFLLCQARLFFLWFGRTFVYFVLF